MEAGSHRGRSSTDIQGIEKRWSYFIRQVYEADLLTCPKCQGEMRIISFIDQQKNLQYLGLWEGSHASPESDSREERSPSIFLTAR